MKDPWSYHEAKHFSEPLKMHLRRHFHEPKLICVNFSLQIKNTDDNGTTKKDPAGSDLLSDGEQWVIEWNFNVTTESLKLLSAFNRRPSVEEIRSWSKSFDKLMRSSGNCATVQPSAGTNARLYFETGGRKIFRDFLRCEYSEENILFWLACEELKQETNPEAIEEKARYIYEDYISILSPKEVTAACVLIDLIILTLLSLMFSGIVRLSS